MVGAPARRRQVEYAKVRGLSERRACALMSVARSAIHYQSRMRQKDAPALAAMSILSAQYPRYGYGQRFSRPGNTRINDARMSRHRPASYGTTGVCASRQPGRTATAMDASTRRGGLIGSRRTQACTHKKSRLNRAFAAMRRYSVLLHDGESRFLPLRVAAAEPVDVFPAGLHCHDRGFVALPAEAAVAIHDEGTFLSLGRRLSGNGSSAGSKSTLLAVASASLRRCRCAGCAPVFAGRARPRFGFSPTAPARARHCWCKSRGRTATWRMTISGNAEQASGVSAQAGGDSGTDQVSAGCHASRISRRRATSAGSASAASMRKRALTLSSADWCDGS